jgi:hypothetical protein
MLSCESYPTYPVRLNVVHENLHIDEEKQLADAESA